MIEYAETILKSFFGAIWRILLNLAPGFQVNFLFLYFDIFVVLMVCTFINRIININVNGDINSYHQSKYNTYTETYSYIDSADIRHTWQHSKRLKHNDDEFI